MDNEPISVAKTKKQSRRKHPYSLNLLHRLFDRETNHDRNSQRVHPSTSLHLQHELKLFKCFTPNFTIQNVDKPHGFMRKFTPNGRFLLSFSEDQRSLDIYEFRGVGAIADLLQTQEKECVTAADSSHMSLLIRQAAFQRLFTLRRSLRMKYGINGGLLNREFSIFLNKGRYVLIAGTGVSVGAPPVDHVFEYPELYTESHLFFYNFYLIDLDGEFISDFYSYKYDSIQLSHNHGVSVYGTTIAIYSKYRQCIDLFEIDDGSLHKTYTIGPTGPYLREPNETFSFDGMVISSMPLTHLKQGILAFIYRMYISLRDVNMRRQKLREFYRDFPKYEHMIISKMQLLGKNNLFIRYEQRPNYRDRDMEDRSDPDIYAFKLYVLYSITGQKIINIYLQNSNELLSVLRDYSDFFRNVRSLQTGRCPSSSSNNIHLLGYFNETIAMLPPDAPQRVIQTLPVSTQSFTASPYLDYSLFLFDDSQISSLERPRISSTDSLCFRDRETERTLFRLNLEPTPAESMMFYNQNDERNISMLPRRELVAFIFHPYEPFVISVQKLLQRYVVNFHIYNKSTVVKE